MPVSNSVMIHKLQKGINQRFGVKLLLNRTQWYSVDQDRPVTTYIVKQEEYDTKSKRYKGVELFNSTSEIQIVLYLRDYWFLLNGWDVPMDNQMWNEIKEKRGVTFPIGVV